MTTLYQLVCMRLNVNVTFYLLEIQQHYPLGLVTNLIIFFLLQLPPSHAYHQ